MGDVTSPTKRPVSQADVAAVVAEALDVEIDPDGCVELPAATFASVWRVGLHDGSRVVLKVSPPATARLLRYEHGLLGEEARYFRLVSEQAAGVPVPAVLFYGASRHLAGAPVLLASYLPGRSLAEASPDLSDAARGEVKEQLGAAVAHVHRIAGSRFGYSGDRPHAATWDQAFIAIVDSLIQDAQDWEMPLPVTPLELGATLRRNQAALADVATPVLVHFDLWDGNILAEPAEAGRWMLSGLVDGERHLFGDPLVDFISTALFRRIEDDPSDPFLTGYRRGSDAEIELSESATTRLRLYRMHLYLLMLVEMPSRGMTVHTHPERFRMLSEHLIHEVADL